MANDWFNQGGSSSDDAIHYKWREAFDFYPYITTEHDVSSAAVYEAHVTLNDGEPSHVPDKAHPSCNTRNQEVPGHFVRVPVLLQLYRDPASPLLRSKDNAIEQIRHFFGKEYRHQISVHLFLDTYKDENKNKLHTRIGMIDTYWSEVRDEYLCVDQSKNYEEDIRFYHCNNPMSISAIYPSYRTRSEKSKDSELLLGVGFPPIEDKKETTRRRTFQRFYVRSDMQEKESFDITEDYLMGTEIGQLFGRAISHQDPTLILYVCRGARLVVCDVRFSVFKSPGSRGVEKHCRSLYQQGSVVIVKGCLAACYLYEGEETE